MTMGAASWPADKVERWPIERLTARAANPRTHSPAQVAQLAASMRKWGWTNPILVAEDGEIIAGHARVLAGRQLGFSEAPVMIAAAWSEAQKRAYVIADNQVALNAGWNELLPIEELQELQTDGFDLGLVGFNPEELHLLNGASEDIEAGRTDEDEAPETPEHPTSALGDVWILGKHRLFCGDATSASDVERLLSGAVPHLMVTDPPYGVEYDATWRADAGVNKNKLKMGKVANDDRADWGEAWSLFPGDVAYVWHAGRYASIVQASLEVCGMENRSQIIWAKDRFALSRGHYHWQHEPCWYAVRKGSTGHWAGDRSHSAPCGRSLLARTRAWATARRSRSSVCAGLS